MIIKYNEYIKESVDSYFLQTYEETKAWLDSMKIKNYTINDDLTVNVNGDVNISHKNLTKIPVKFNKVSGNFNCSYNELTSLIFAPNRIAYFNCESNKLSSLDGAPKIAEYFVCDNNKLINLKHSPIKVNNFYCHNNTLENISDLDSKILIKSIKEDYYWTKHISTELYDDYFEHWISKDFNIISVLKDKVSKIIKDKYKHLFNANNFDLI